MDNEENKNEFGNIVQDILGMVEDVPFENSIYQEYMFVINESQTPGRVIRSIGLRAKSKVDALRNYHYEMKLLDIKLEKFRREIERLKSEDNATEDKDLEISRMEIEVERAMVERNQNMGLIRDALSTLAYLYENLKRLPKYSREDFEKEERLHFEKRLDLALVASQGRDSGAMLSKMLMTSKPAEESLKLIGCTIKDPVEFANEVDTALLERNILPLFEVNPNKLIKDGTDN